MFECEYCKIEFDCENVHDAIIYDTETAFCCEDCEFEYFAERSPYFKNIDD